MCKNRKRCNPAHRNCEAGNTAAEVPDEFCKEGNAGMESRAPRSWAQLSASVSCALLSFNFELNFKPIPTGIQP